MILFLDDFFLFLRELSYDFHFSAKKWRRRDFCIHAASLSHVEFCRPQMNKVSKSQIQHLNACLPRWNHQCSGNLGEIKVNSRNSIAVKIMLLMVFWPKSVQKVSYYYEQREILSFNIHEDDLINYRHFIPAIDLLF